MSSFMHEDIVGRRRAERERCNDAARRSKGPLLVGYINAANYYGAPIPRHCTLSVDAVHACVSSANKRRRIKGVVFHVFKGKLDIRKKDYEQFWIASPVMMWAQMAQYSTLEELAAIGASLMSRDKRRRMATRKDFDTYLEISPRFIGRNKCHEALPYMTENTDSPPENTLFGMPKDSGLGCPTANYRVNIGNSYVILDMAYPDCRVAFEYQGAYHADPAQMRIDAAKRNALQLLGWIVILVTADDLRTADTRHRFIEMAHVVVSRQRNLADWNRSWAINTKAARHGVLVHVNGLQVNEPIHADSALHCLDHQVAGAVVKRFAHQQRTGLKRQRRLQKCEAAQAHTANSRSANPRKVWPMPSVRKAPSASSTAGRPASPVSRTSGSSGSWAISGTS